MAAAAAAALVGLAAASSDASSARSSSQSARDQTERNRGFAIEAEKRARADIFPRFEQGQRILSEGFQGAGNVISGAVPSQIGSFQQGNVGAQQQLLAGLPQIQRAILGLPTDTRNIFQPTQITPNLGFLNTPFPDFNAGGANQFTDRPAVTPESIAEALAKLNPGGGGLNIPSLVPGGIL